MTQSHAKGDIKDPSLAQQGIERIEWAMKEMPVLNQIKKRFKESQPLKGMVISGCLHITCETANLALTLKSGGAKVFMCASNPLSTQDDVAAALTTQYGIPTYAINNVDNETYYQHINAVLDQKPNVTMDDGADLVATLHTEKINLLDNIIGGTEETTTGVIRLKSLAKENKLKYPIIAVNEAETKHLFDNRYGTGQSTLDGITRATNILWAGKTVVVCGYGWCGKGVALRARGMGANTIVTEVNPTRALEAAMDGHRVMSMSEASKIGDIFITLTGCMNVIAKSHFELMKNGAIIANSGHFNVEIEISALEQLSKTKNKISEAIDEYILPDKRKLYLLGEGRLINLAAAEGHPSAVMDMSFANQALCAEYLSQESKNLNLDVHNVPAKIDQLVGSLKLQSMNMYIDKLTAQQQKYLTSWSIGT
ncbi:MAG: adenosylhomocysteinase [SAR202 cluster bacterium]|nr:adenosylhomocysteinase [SAR202 cluster bacterium]|tara:strand:+ start:13726 stop:14997 length:1272 start_codon:yes stop_codon:yes gene_type:complete